MPTVIVLWYGLSSSGGVLTLTIAPTAATMGTDDICLLSGYISYTRRSLVVTV